MDLQLNELHALIRLQNFIFKVWLHELAFVNIAISIGHGVLNHFSDWCFDVDFGEALPVGIVKGNMKLVIGKMRSDRIRGEPDLQSESLLGFKH